jgi:hypothetical protein
VIATAVATNQLPELNRMDRHPIPKGSGFLNLK